MLRTDDSSGSVEVDEIDAARAREYALLSTLLTRSPDVELLDRLAHMTGDATPLGAAHGALGAAAARTNAESAAREHFDLFIGLGRGELLPYASYYRTGFLYGRPLAALREDLGRLGVERAPGQSEPEDHAAVLCEVMARLAGGGLGSEPDCDRKFFERHLGPWIGSFFADLERAGNAQFYTSVGALGRTVVAMEAEAFALPQ